ncbi:MAG: RDD family protein [Pseudomonadota bacterium]
MENPYSAPTSQVHDSAEEVADEMASRMTRLMAAIVDGIILMVLVLPFTWVLGFWDLARSGGTLSFGMTVASVALGFGAYVLVNGVLLARYGQTVGKRLLKIRIVSLQGEQLPLGKILLARQLPVQVMSVLPGVGGLLAILDVLFIFRKDQRCLHDLIAKTRVINCKPG